MFKTRKRPMANGFILKASLMAGAALTALVLLLQRDLTVPLDDPAEAAVARQELRVEAARASLDAAPLFGESHLPPFDAKAAMAREQSELRRLSSLQSASR